MYFEICINFPGSLSVSWSVHESRCASSVQTLLSMYQAVRIYVILIYILEVYFICIHLHAHSLHHPSCLPTYPPTHLPTNYGPKSTYLESMATWLANCPCALKPQQSGMAQTLLNKYNGWELYGSHISAGNSHLRSIASYPTLTSTPSKCSPFRIVYLCLPYKATVCNPELSVLPKNV